MLELVNHKLQFEKNKLIGVRNILIEEKNTLELVNNKVQLEKY